jgi:phosphopantetheinyl transferase
VELALGEAHVWVLRPEPPKQLDEGTARAKDAFRVGLGGAAACALVAKYLGIETRELEVQRTCLICRDKTHGKPRVVTRGTSGSFCRLEINSTKACNQVWIAVARQRVGIDAEPVERAAEKLVPDVALNLTERSWCVAKRQMEDVRRLFLWTRKEAVLKLTGHGISVPPSSIGVLSRPPIASELAQTVQPWTWNFTHSAEGRRVAIASASPVVSVSMGETWRRVLVSLSSDQPVEVKLFGGVLYAPADGLDVRETEVDVVKDSGEIFV